MKLQSLTTTSARRGFSIMEIVVAMIIISILVLILTPILSSRAAQARLRSAEQEMEHLANAFERAAIDTNYLFRMDVLNDSIGGDSVANETQLTRGINGTRDIALSTLYSQPKKIFISLETLDFVSNFAFIYDEQFTRNETAFGWNGPYLNWKRDANLNDWPDDPWGHDYLFFTPAGILVPPDPNNPSASTRDDQFSTTGQNGQPTDLIFDRPTILSVGPDGLPGDGIANPTGDGDYGTGDDLVRKF